MPVEQSDEAHLRILQHQPNHHDWDGPAQGIETEVVDDGRWLPSRKREKQDGYDEGKGAMGRTRTTQEHAVNGCGTIDPEPGKGIRSSDGRHGNLEVPSCQVRQS